MLGESPRGMLKTSSRAAMKFADAPPPELTDRGCSGGWEPLELIDTLLCESKNALKLRNLHVL